MGHTRPTGAGSGAVRMGLRKRYTVVVVGVEGSATAQRSELGRFRSEDAARSAGHEEWRRLLFVHAPHADLYRVVIERDGEEMADVPPPAAAGEEEPAFMADAPGPAPAAPPAPAGVDDEAPTGAAPAIGDTPTPAEAADAAPASGPGEDGATTAGEEPPAPGSRLTISALDEEPIPDGPVPEEVIARFAEAVRAEEERAAARAARKGDTA